MKFKTRYWNSSEKQKLGININSRQDNEIHDISTKNF